MRKTYLWLGLLPVLGLLLLGLGIAACLFVPIDNLGVHESTPFEIPPNTPARAIATQLRAKGFIRSPLIFVLWTHLTGTDRDLHKGYYLLNPNMNTLSIHAILREKTGTHRLMKVTIPEGFSIAQVADRLAEAHVVGRNEFIAVAGGPPVAGLVEYFPYLKDRMSMEGFLFPDTYLFAAQVPAEQVILTMLKTFNEKVFVLWGEGNRNAPLDFYETLILASIVEKEALLSIELPEIAGVYVHRLALRMPLGADPTIRYALGNPSGRGVTWKDLKVDSNYNTYRRTGLPPTPIASPGKLAFAAAMNPARTANLYFLAKNDQSNSHDFSRSLSEHNRKRIKYKYAQTR